MLFRTDSTGSTGSYWYDRLHDFSVTIPRCLLHTRMSMSAGFFLTQLDFEILRPLPQGSNLCRWHILRFDTGWQEGIPFLPISVLLGLTCVVWYNSGLFFPKSVIYRDYYFPKCIMIRDCFSSVDCNYGLLFLK